MGRFAFNSLSAEQKMDPRREEQSLLGRSRSNGTSIVSSKWILRTSVVFVTLKCNRRYFSGVNGLSKQLELEAGSNIYFCLQNRDVLASTKTNRKVFVPRNQPRGGFFDQF